MQAALGRPIRSRRAGKAEHIDASAAEVVLDKIHDKLYPSVLRGVGPEELDIKERNRRATFARSAASTVRYFIRQGGDVRTVDIPTISKSGLRKLVEPEAAEPESETRMERSLRKSQEAFIKSAQRMLARGDPDMAIERIEASIEALQAMLDELDKAAETRASETTTSVQRGVVSGRVHPNAMLHRSS
jgi:crotonobetainyl-CoA:carnitine CoA-transferase CaiB-like acyl-CoA transferase